jgi:hypothetical protein
LADSEIYEDISTSEFSMRPLDLRGTAGIPAPGPPFLAPVIGRLDHQLQRTCVLRIPTARTALGTIARVREGAGTRSDGPCGIQEIAELRRQRVLDLEVTAVVTPQGRKARFRERIR